MSPPQSADPELSSAELEASLLGVMLSAETARDGAAALLDVLAPALGDSTAALALRDRDGLTLHVLAEVGAPRAWPSLLAPQFAAGRQMGVDPGTGALVVPLRANGRVIGALLLADASRGSQLLQESDLTPTLDAAASVLHALASRTDAELRRRAVALRSVESIVDGMAHQIANPLTGASAIAQLLVEDLEDEGQRAAVKQIQHELGRAFTVLRDILDFQRDTHARDGILDLNAIVERIMRFRGYAIREMGIALDVTTLPGFLPVRVDARGLDHAMLIALRFAELESHGTVNRSIDVRVSERGVNELAVEITDSGPGNPPELSAAYFDLPLLRGEHSTRDATSEQPDLGLVASILRGAGGRLDVTSSKANGTTLALVLPRASTPHVPPDGRKPS
jgi:signal transduction histidine kinase